ncbi:MAG: CpaF family protein [Sphingomonadaceae bacterium]
MNGFGRRSPLAVTRPVMDPPDIPRAVPTDQATARALLQPLIARQFDPAEACEQPRGTLANAIGNLITQTLEAQGRILERRAHRELVTHFVNGLVGAGRLINPEKPPSGNRVISAAERALPLVMPKLLERIDTAAASTMTRGELGRRLRDMVTAVLTESMLSLNAVEQRELVSLLIDDMLGLGPLEPLLADDSITDILCNGPGQIYVERKGKLEPANARFRSTEHMMGVITRIVSNIGRRIDEANPLVDARLADGSRVNIIIPPLALDGPAISIRKFTRQTLDLDRMVEQGNMSPAMAMTLKIATRARLNILISGGTGSGKTTLLNALSKMIAPDERVVTIEDAAELQMQQPHVVRLETRPSNLEGRGEVTQRDLLKNALRMRPDRIILGEIRGAEALDMLQAMNTGHDGSLGTIHANRPREALTRLENMVAMAGFRLPSGAVRSQIADAVQLVIQTARMRDGMRRITSIAEVTGVESQSFTMQELFAFRQTGTRSDGSLVGNFESTGVRPHFLERAAAFDLGELLLEAMAS